MTIGSPDQWTDEEVIAGSNVTMADADDRRLSELLEMQAEGLIDSSGRDELKGLMGLYERGLLRKALSLAEAVRRGLREPLEP